ncbi:uncharacterized protein LOC119684791 [Teleopsis dalmanni]|uniref:uncharacterized protein LOC119684791 n=1 Tax=Teleopsis dalmanni TaxID=139649 RepID=UPI0018CFC132|nr:uncharacterized protein LOC119684791 [Teleopsis dalmanni]
MSDSTLNKTDEIFDVEMTTSESTTSSEPFDIAATNTKILVIQDSAIPKNKNLAEIETKNRHNELTDVQTFGESYSFSLTNGPENGKSLPSVIENDRELSFFMKRKMFDKDEYTLAKVLLQYSLREIDNESDTDAMEYIGE